MNQKLVYIYVERIVNTCKMMILNPHIIKDRQNPRDIFIASLMTNLHYGVDSVEIIDTLLYVELIQSCEINMMISYGFSISDALCSYRDSIIKSYLLSLHKSLYTFDINKYI